MRSSALSVLALFVGGACASAPKEPPVAGAAGSANAGATQQSAPARANRDVITRDELTKPSVANMTVLDAIKSLRPQFLTVRGTNTMAAKENNDPDGRPINDMESGKPHASIDGNKIVPVGD